jgi:hypothetical protein
VLPRLPSNVEADVIADLCVRDGQVLFFEELSDKTAEVVATAARVDRRAQ